MVEHQFSLDGCGRLISDTEWSCYANRSSLENLQHMVNLFGRSSTAKGSTCGKADIDDVWNVPALCQDCIIRLGLMW